MEPFRIRLEAGNRLTLRDRVCKLVGWQPGDYIQVDVVGNTVVLSTPKRSSGDNVVALRRDHRRPQPKGA